LIIKGSIYSKIPIVLVLWAGTLKSQILNIDREHNDTLSRTGYLLMSGSLSKDKQIRNIQDFNFYSETLVKSGFQHYGLVGMFQTDITLSGTETVQNEGYVQFRYRDLDARKISLDPFVQYQWNGLWGLQSRFLYGCNTRYRVFDNAGADTYAGLGVFYQVEDWQSGADNLASNEWRLNFTVKSAEKLSNKLDYVDQIFIQLPVQGFQSNEANYRLYNYIEIVYELNKYASLGFNADLFWTNTKLGETDKFMYGYGMNCRILLQ
jgi:hypothetical protein